MAMLQTHVLLSFATGTYTIGPAKECNLININVEKNVT